MDERESSRENEATAAEAGIGGSAARVDSVVDLLASWGAAAHPAIADLFHLISVSRNVADLLKSLHRIGREFLPAPLHEEIGQAVAILSAGGSLNAPSFRARADRLLARAKDALGSHLEGRRAVMAAQIRSWAVLLEGEDLNSTLQRLWRSERWDHVSDQLVALEELERAQAALDRARDSFGAEIDARTGAADAALRETLDSARAALASGDPLELARAKRSLGDLRARADRGARLASWNEARARLAALCEQARARIGENGGRGGGVLLPAQTLDEAQRSLQEAISDPAGLESLQPVLETWERTMRAVLEADSAAGETTPTERPDLAAAFRREFEGLLPPDSEAGEPGRETAVREASEIEATLREAARPGGRPFHAALERAVDFLRRGRLDAEARRKEAEARLRDSSRALASLLEKAGESLPTARVLQARLWLEQVEGMASAVQTAGMESLNRAIHDDLEELRRLAAHAQKKRTNREEAEREALRSEISRLLDVASRRSARQLQALAAASDRAEGDEIGRLRGRLERVRGEMEQALRLQAGKVLKSGERIVRRAGKGPEGRRQEEARDLARLVESLSASMEKDDLAQIRERAAELRSALRRAAPLTRPGVRLVIGGAALLVLAGAYFVMGRAGARARTYHLRLDADPPQPVSIWIVRDGRIVARGEYRGGAEGARFELAPGRYEIFVDERYTGRVLRVPEEAGEVTGIPLPHAPE